MNQLLKINSSLRTEYINEECKVKEFIGGGGQGEVYRAEIGGRSVALKYYFPHTATPEQKLILEYLIKKGAPNNKFLWPLDIAHFGKSKGFGYIMHLRENRFKSIVDLMKRKIEPSFKALTSAGFELADSFFQLHSRGLSYRDISFGNVFFDPELGDILICDNDNVAIDGKDVSGVIGTPRFMAPEIVRGEAMPSKYTDLFSLSVLLFYMFMVHHPLEGRKEKSIKCLDLPAMNKIYGSSPLFIFDPADRSNEPVRGFHDNALVFWSIYPQFIKDLFTKAFTVGLSDPLNGRVAESVWRSSMIKLRDSIFYCSKCGLENFYDIARIDNSLPHICWGCRAILPLPPKIKIGSTVIVLNFDTKIFPHHLGDLYNFSEGIGEVVRHPSNPALWGIKNLSKQCWYLSKPDGTSIEVIQGKSSGISYGNKIDFGGNTIGEIIN